MMQITGAMVCLTLAIAFLFGSVSVVPVHAQFNSDNPILQAIPQFQYADDRLLNDIAPDTDFGFFVSSIAQDIREAVTFDPVEKAEIKLEHARMQQEEINRLDSTGMAIPIAVEERRIEKLNEASEIINGNWNNGEYELDDLLPFDKEYKTLREMGEINDIRILYSQLPSVIDSDELTKIKYNEKVNSLDTWRNNCNGAFSVDDMKPLNKAVEKLEVQCPKLVDLQNKFGYERLKMMVSGTV